MVRIHQGALLQADRGTGYPRSLRPEELQQRREPGGESPNEEKVKIRLFCVVSP